MAWHWLYEHRVFNIEVTALSFVILFFAEDYVFYIKHRIQHRVNYFRAVTHVVHHSSNEFNLWTSMRTGIFNPLSGLWMFWGLLCFLGFPPAMMIFQAGISRIYQGFTHTETVHRLPAIIEFFFVTPSHHRVHHARNEIYLDKNYGGILIIWDRLFGSFQEERADEPCDYGVRFPR